MTARNWIAAIVVTLLGIGLMAWLMPLAARVPYWMSPDLFRRFMGSAASKGPLVDTTPATTVFVGVVIVVVCICLYLWWTDRPLVIRYASRKYRRPGRRSKGGEPPGSEL